MRQVDSSTPTPDSARRIVKRLKITLNDDLAVKSVLQCAIMFLGSVQDVFPSIYALNKLYTLSGEGGDYTIYDSMRPHVIKLMDDCHKRILKMRSCSATLRKLFLKLAAHREEIIKKLKDTEEYSLTTTLLCE